MTTPTYGLLGRSGLRVSPLALGTMTFGQAGWGCDRDASRALLDHYLEWGGNFIDTADRYGDGASEEIIGEYLAERGVRDSVVLATKYSLGTPDHPNATGNGRIAMRRAIERSLQRLRTDYIDLYYMHAWDGITPVDEVVGGLQDLVSEGKVRYVALSDSPAWYVSRAHTLAEWHGHLPVCAVQLEYSLAERGIELEYPAMCAELGMDIVGWGPLASGLLTGSHTREESPAGSRRHLTAGHVPPTLDKDSERNWATVETLREIAEQTGRSGAQVAIGWLLSRPAVGSILLGARTIEQLEDTLGAADAPLPAEALERLTAASAPEYVKPYDWFGWGQAQTNMNGAVARRSTALTAVSR